ncbi:rhomboid protein 1, mitochondrial [Trichomonascus vanleenenianus]|uniref:rhomboid protease PCP1 n=1 Tax=Trichomonascus vanleenenianus TaxID=2268995 RepID=UPI003ECAF74D
MSFVRTHGKNFFLANIDSGATVSRFFSKNFSQAAKSRPTPLWRQVQTGLRSNVWTRLPAAAPVEPMKSSLNPLTMLMRSGFKRSMATHRELGGRYYKGREDGGSNWKAKLRWNWYLYKVPLLFTGGVIAFNALAWQYIYQIPGLEYIRRHPESVVYGIIGINTLVFFAWKAPGKILKYVTRYGLLFKDSNFNKWGMLGSAFSHQGFMHLAINMFVLHNFGIPLAKMLGAATFTEIYLDGAILSSLISIMAPVLTGRKILAPSLGASGAVFTMFGLLSYLLPHMKVSLYFIPIPLNAWEVFLASMGVNAAGLFFRWGAIDYAGHLGGSIAALVWGKIVQTRIEKRREAMRRSSRGGFGFF